MTCWIVKRAFTGCLCGYWTLPIERTGAREIAILPKVLTMSELLNDDITEIRPVVCQLDWRRIHMTVPVATALYGHPNFVLADNADGWMRQLNFGKP
jgi:hypothetical protein